MARKLGACMLVEWQPRWRWRQREMSWSLIHRRLEECRLEPTKRCSLGRPASCKLAQRTQRLGPLVSLSSGHSCTLESTWLLETPESWSWPESCTQEPMTETLAPLGS